MTMRADVKPGSTFPDYRLPDHTGTPRRLSEIQGGDPMIIVLARESTLAQEELPRDLSILRTIARGHSGCLGVYGSVISGGLVRVGAPVILAGPSDHLRTT
jgi:hypothetical protein